MEVFLDEAESETVDLKILVIRNQEAECNWFIEADISRGK